MSTVIIVPARDSEFRTGGSGTIMAEKSGNRIPQMGDEEKKAGKDGGPLFHSFRVQARPLRLKKNRNPFLTVLENILGERKFPATRLLISARVG